MAVSKLVKMVEMQIMSVWVILSPAWYEQLKACGDNICVRVLLRIQKSQQKLMRNLISHPDLDFNFVSAVSSLIFFMVNPVKWN